jgi:hypothetical protein
MLSVTLDRRTDKAKIQYNESKRGAPSCCERVILIQNITSVYVLMPVGVQWSAKVLKVVFFYA